jgi:hypothetical protein
MLFVLMMTGSPPVNENDYSPEVAGLPIGPDYCHHCDARAKHSGLAQGRHAIFDRAIDAWTQN